MRLKHGSSGADSVNMLRSVLAVALSVLCLTSCGQEDEIAAQRETVEQLFESTAWPEGYEQLIGITSRNPNLDSLNTQPGVVSTRYSAGSRSISNVRDDFHNSLIGNGFILEAGSICDSEGLTLNYIPPDNATSTFPLVRYSPEREPFAVTVQFIWTLPSEESREALGQRTAGELPSCE